MKKGNRLAALLLAAVMMFSLLPASALAAADEAPVAETPLGEEAVASAEAPEAADEPSAAAELAAGDITVTVAEDDTTLIAANNVSWSAVEGATSYTVTLTSPTHTDVQSTGAASSVWYQDDTARTVKLVNLYPGTQYTVTVTGGGKSGSATFTTKSVTNSVAEELKNDPEAPRPYGALPDDQQLYYHDRDMAAFIHFGPNTYSGRSWGTGWETPATFALQAGELTENDPYYASHGGQIPKFVDQWIKELQDAGFERLVMVGKHHDGFCLWDSAVTEHNVTNSPYGRDLLADVSAACSKYGMDMGFYLSPWDQNATSFGYWTEADRTQRTTEHLLDRTRKDEDVSGDYNEFYIQQLREVLGNKKYGRDGVFVETWMDGAKGKFFQYQEGSTVGTNTNRDVDQEYDFDAYFKVIRELQPQCLIYTDRADGGIRWSGNEVGSTGANPAGTGAGDMCWQTMDIATFNYEGTDTPGMLKPWKANKWPRQLGQENGHIWSVCECDVSIETEWFWHPGNGTRSLDSLVDMYLTSVGYGSPFLLNVPPSQDGTFRDGTSVRLAELGKAIQDTFRTDLAAGKSVTASATRDAADSTKFAPGNLTDGDGDNFWAMNDDQTTGWVEVNLGSLQVFDVVSIQEFIALGQRIKAGTVEYHDAEGQWKEFGTFTTVGAKRIIRSAPVQGDRIRVKITASNATPVLRSVGVYKARSGMEVKNTIPEAMTYMDDRDSGFTYVGSWAEVGNEGYSDTRKGGNGANNSVSGSFTGSMFYLMGITDTAHGKVKIEIDAGTEHAITETVNTYSASRKAKAILYTSPPLSDGPHTVKFSRVDGWFEFDGIFYLPLGSSLVEFEKAAYQTFPDSDLELKIVRSGDASRAIQLQINDLPGTAVQGQHYAPVQETVTMAAGERELTVTFHTLNGSPGNLAAGKDYSAAIMGCSDGNTTLGVNATATITIVDPDTVPQTPKGETYTADDPFQLPAAVGKSRKLEAEHMILDFSGAETGKEVRVSTDNGASNGKKLGWFEPNNKVILHYNAPQAGVYTVTLRYQSGRTESSAGGLNKVNWRGQNVEDFSGTIPGTGGDGSNYGEHSYQLTVTEAGEGSIEFYADASACPNIDWITFRLNPPTTEDPGEIVVPDGLVGYWTFDGDTQAEKLTSKVNGLTATLTNRVSLADSDLNDGSGGGVRFDGSNGAYLTLNLTGDNALTAAQSFSVGGWIKHTDWATDTSSQQIPSVFHAGGGQAILAFQHNNADTGRFSSYLGGTNTFDTRGVKLDAWCHVMLVYTKEGDTGSLRFYVNGVASEAVNVSAPNFNVSGADQNLVGKILVGAHRNGSEPSVKAVMDEIRYYNRAITADEIKTIYDKDKPPVPPLTVTVDPETEVRQITPAMFGINHRYHNDGYGSWDKENAKIYDAFQALCKQAGFGSVRYPGGTVANLFTWKDAIGPVGDRTPTIAGNNFYTRANQAEVGGADPVDPVFGVDEAMTWIYDDLNAEAIFVYGLGRGNPDDAAELVEYLNAPATEEYPWAMRRAENGHPEPYGVTKFEIGNEFSDIGQRYWMEGKPSGANDVDIYIDGGIMTIDGTRNQYNGNPLNYVVRKGDWRPLASKSKGAANEVYYVCYTPVVADSAHVKVAGTEWTIVDSLADQAADAQVCTFDYATGEIRFGDGTHGAIPALDARITCDYQTRQQGFVAYYDKMKEAAAKIGVEIEIYSGIVDRQQQSFISKMNEKGFNDKYDGVIYHPYSGGGQCSYAASLTKEKEYAATIGTLKRAMDNATGTTTKEVAVSEFGINANNDYVASMGNAIYTANHLIDCVNAGAAYLNRHCLVDFTTGDNLGNWQQSVIQCHRQGDGTYRYVATPSAHVFQLFNTMTGNVEVAQTVTGNADYIGSAVQTVNVYSTKDGNGTVYVLVVNNDEQNETAVELGVKDMSLSGRTIEVQYLTSDAVLDQNTLAEPDKVQVQTAQVEVAEDAEILRYTMKPHSVYAFRISGETVTVDTAALEAAITNANAAKQGVQTIDGKTEDQVNKGTKFVTTAEMKALTDAIAAAEEARDAEDKTEDSVARALTALNNAVEAFADAVKTGTKTSRPSGNSNSTTTEARDDGTKVTTVTKPDGSKTETVEQPDGTKAETVTAKNGDVTITVTDPEGEEIVKTELPAKLPEPELTFEDVPETHWAQEAIKHMVGLGLAKGVGGNQYDAAVPMSRGALATVLHRLSNGQKDYDVTFKDVAETKFYAPGVAWAAKAGVVTGYTADIFAPEDVITREQLAVMLARYAKLIGMNTKADAKALDKFNDGQNTGSWAVDGMAWCVENGIIRGKDGNRLDPTTNVSRAEVAVMLDRFIELLK